MVNVVWITTTMKHFSYTCKIDLIDTSLYKHYMYRCRLRILSLTVVSSWRREPGYVRTGANSSAVCTREPSLKVPTHSLYYRVLCNVLHKYAFIVIQW